MYKLFLNNNLLIYLWIFNRIEVDVGLKLTEVLLFMHGEICIWVLSLIGWVWERTQWCHAGVQKKTINFLKGYMHVSSAGGDIRRRDQSSSTHFLQLWDSTVVEEIATASGSWRRGSWREGLGGDIFGHLGLDSLAGGVRMALSTWWLRQF